jgi:hypothetical protein
MFWRESPLALSGSKSRAMLFFAGKFDGFMGSFIISITPFPAFPEGGRSNQAFPPWGKMKGGIN